ncbi:hypothetical protein FA048_03005 [Pedobacter polaris]|uniref:FAD-dependent oxidoreductase n=1 Tax=Pedobacter polaris TaxID=2571273 RepID=A0A4V5P3A1_9SPHI|nr:hypothetical protein [Pedobacter polaris]TKC12602.1 hypothetical protein FA048_03005 [Pedobacter polaris]
MKKNLFFVLALLTFFGSVKAQTLRPGVLVVGNGNAAVSAALQSAISGVETIILLQAGGFDISPINDDLNSGIQATFLKKIREAKQIKDSTQAVTFDKPLANDILTAWTYSIKKLTVIKNIMWVKADGYVNSWVFKLSDGRTIRAKVLVNPADAKLNEALKVTTATNNQPTKLDYSNTIYRTSVAAGMSNNEITANTFSLYQLFVPEHDNFIWIANPQNMLIGQAAGATAAYAAFYNKKTSESNLKKIQGELINYKLNMIPFVDIKQADSNWKAIQFVGLTGVLKAEMIGNKAFFVPQKLITTTEVKQPIKDFFYKAQIWFDDYKSDKMTIGSTIDMVCYVGNKALENTKKELAKKWKTNYQFNSEFDLERQINRKEFAVILQDYMPPFNVNVDEKGKVIR